MRRLFFGLAIHWGVSHSSEPPLLPENELEPNSAATGILATYGKHVESGKFHLTHGTYSELLDTSPTPILGAATIEETEYTVMRSTNFENWHFKCPSPVGWSLSKLGCATCKISSNRTDAVDAAQLQIIKGLNVFELNAQACEDYDTFSKGIADTFAAFELKREGFVIVARTGTIRQTTADLPNLATDFTNIDAIKNRFTPIWERLVASTFPKVAFRKGFRFDLIDDDTLKSLQMRRIGKHAVAVNTPRWLNAAVAKFGVQTGIDCIDVFLIEGLHTLFDGRPQQHIDNEIMDMMRFCEDQARRRNIQFYGFSSAFFAPPLPRTYPPMPSDANCPRQFIDPQPPPVVIDLYRLMFLAEQVGGKNHRFRFLEFPFNLTQSQAYYVPLPYDSSHTLSSLAKKLGITTIGHSPAEAPDLQDQPQRYHSFPLIRDLKGMRMNMVAILERIVLKEMELRPALQKMRDPPNPDHIFFGSKYVHMQMQLTNLFVFDNWIRNEVERPFRDGLKILRVRQGDEGKDWARHYEQLVQEFIRVRRQLYNHKHGKMAIDIDNAINRNSPTLNRCPILTQKAVNFAAACCDVVLSGFHHTRYFHEATDLNPARNGGMTLPLSEIDALCRTLDVSYVNVNPPNPYMFDDPMVRGKFSGQKTRQSPNLVPIDTKNPKFPDIPEELETEKEPEEPVDDYDEYGAKISSTSD